MVIKAPEPSSIRIIFLSVKALCKSLSSSKVSSRRFLPFLYILPWEDEIVVVSKKVSCLKSDERVLSFLSHATKPASTCFCVNLGLLEVSVLL